MENMRTLNRSLPSTPQPAPPASKPPEILLQHFKDAALSVTKLYKEAQATEARARQAGYQDALEELISFLDRENLGVQDGEGWDIRQWVTERLDGTAHFVSGGGLNGGGNGSGNVGESDDEREASAATPSSAPAAAQQQQPPPPQPTAQPEDIIYQQDEEQQQHAHSQPTPASHHPPESDSFSFRSRHPYPPTEVLMDITNNHPSTSASGSSSNNNHPSAPSPLRRASPPRSSRASSRNTSPRASPKPAPSSTTAIHHPAVRAASGPHHLPFSARRGSLSKTSSRSSSFGGGVGLSGLGSGAGAKRKFALNEFFDFGGLDPGYEGGGGKRGRID